MSALICKMLGHAVRYKSWREDFDPYCARCGKDLRWDEL